MPALADRSGAETRDAIIEAAARTFRAKGYESATLGEIAAELNITRSAVLHHFASKQALLEEVVAPYIAGIDAMLDRREAAGRITARGRRPFLVELVDVVCDHPDVSAMMAFDVSVRSQLPPPLQVEARAARFADIITVTVDDPHGFTRALAAIGAILRPIYAPPGMIDLGSPETRQVLVDAAMAVFSTAPSSHS